MHTEHVVGPHARFLASSGDSFWIQAEVTRRYKNGTSVPLLWEVKLRVLG